MLPDRRRSPRNARSAAAAALSALLGAACPSTVAVIDQDNALIGELEEEVPRLLEENVLTGDIEARRTLPRCRSS